MGNSFRYCQAIFTLAGVSLSGIAHGHAMPTYIAEDQVWRLWPDGVVAYEFVGQAIAANNLVPQPQLPLDAAARRALEEAMQHIGHKTGGAIVFMPSADHPRRVRFSLMPNSPDVGFCGMASVGHVATTGSLQIADRPECKTRAVALHELMHTLGFLHENQRFQAIMDRERRAGALDRYADKRTTVDHDSITYNDGQQGERLDALKDPTDMLLVRLKHGLDTTGRWFQELSAQDVVAIQHYYSPERTLEKQLARAARERPWLRFTRFELANGQCLQTGAPGTLPKGKRELFVARCDTISAGQRWALDPQGALHSLAYPGQCVGKLHQTDRPSHLGSFAVLETCRPNDPMHHWEVQGQRLINRAQPHLMLGYEPGARTVLAWNEDARLMADWRRDATVAARPVGNSAPPAPDPWQQKLKPVRHATRQVYRLQIGERCLSDAGPDRRLREPGEHLVRLLPCQPGAAQQWILDQGRLASLQQPGLCLGNTGLHEATRDDRPAFVGLQRCRSDRPSQNWTLQGIQGSNAVMVTTRLNPLLANDYRLLEARPDGLLHFGTPASPRHQIAWRAIAEVIPGTRPPVVSTPASPTAPPIRLSHAAGRPIPLLGGDLPVRGRPLCLNAQASRPAGFAVGEIGAGIAYCDGSAEQRWLLHDDGRLTTPSRPGLCLGRNQARQGQEVHGQYRRLAFRDTGFVALQPCRPNDATQQWAWRATRYHHQGETRDNGGAQLVLRRAPDLSLVVHAKARGPQLSIGQPDIADHFQFFRWQPTHAPGPLAGAAGGARVLNWARPEADWRRDAPGYIGRGVNMSDRQRFQQLRWHDSRQCLGLRPDGAWRLTLQACRPDTPEQGWRIDEQYRLINQRYPGQCLQRAANGVTLGDCAAAQALPHWFLNDSRQLDSLDMSPLRLVRDGRGDIMLSDRAFQGRVEGWQRD